MLVFLDKVNIKGIWVENLKFDFMDVFKDGIWFYGKYLGKEGYRVFDV